MSHATAIFAPGLGHCWQRKDPDLHIRMVEAWLTGQQLPAELLPEPPPSPAAVERMRATGRPQGDMFVHESGTPGSPAIVFIHGDGQSGRIWGEHMAKLAGFHCLAPDLPGFGQSNGLAWASVSETADLVAALIETRVPARRAHVVGLSLGAVVIHALLNRHPDRVERAVIDGAPVRAWGRRLRPLSFIVVSPFLHTRPVTALFRDVMDEEDLRVASRRAFWRSAAEGFLKPIAAIGAPNPTLLIAGEKETNRTLTGCGIRESNAALVALMAHAEARFAPGLGHCWQRKDPELHIRMVEAWLTGQQLPAELRPEPTPSASAVKRLRRQLSGTGGPRQTIGPLGHSALLGGRGFAG
jgi:pimeloyl-ACP methyl ester carboxylesterase